MLHKILPEIKVMMVSVAGVGTSFIGYNLTGLDWFRILVLTATLSYTVRRWYLMEKRNKNYKNNQENKKQNDEKSN